MDVYGHTIPVWTPYAALAAAALLTAGYLAGRRARRKSAEGQDRASRGDLVAAAVATAVSAEGMWETFGGLGMPVPLRVGTFAFIEIMTIQCARRAARSMRKDYSPGADGIAMWVLTCLSAILSVSHEITEPDTNAAVVLVRLVAPLVAAWGWERNMRLERRRRLRQRREQRINWTITPERIAVRLGLAEASERTTPQVDARRRIARLAQAVNKLAALEAADARERRLTRARKRLNRLMAEANEHAGLARDTDLQAELKAEIASLLGAANLARLSIPAWWDEPAGPVLTEEEHGLLAEVPAASDRLMRAVQGYRRHVLHGVTKPPNGHRSTISTTRPTSSVAAPLTVVDAAAHEARFNQDFNQPDQRDHAGQAPLPDLASTIRAAKARGMSERQIAKRFRITRHQVRTLLDQPPSTSGDQGGPDPAMNGTGGR
jgi:DNA invertase Pin-like site-specific DNA recombinase